MLDHTTIQDRSSIITIIIQVDTLPPCITVRCGEGHTLCLNGTSIVSIIITTDDYLFTLFDPNGGTFFYLKYR